MKLPSQNHFTRSEDASSFYLTFIAHLSRGCDRLREYFEILTKQSERPLLALFRQPYRMDPKSFENTAAEGTQIFSPSSVPLMSVVKPEERGFDSIPWLKDEAQDSPRMPWKTRHFKAAIILFSSIPNVFAKLRESNQGREVFKVNYSKCGKYPPKKPILDSGVQCNDPALSTSFSNAH